MASSWKLTTAQRELLVAFAGYPHGEGVIRPLGRRSANILVRYRYLKSVGGGWYKITEQGKAAIADD